MDSQEWLLFQSHAVDPYGKPVSSRVTQVGSRHRLEFEPTDVGPHVVDVRYAGQAVQGSPYTSDVYDVSRVRIDDAPSGGVVGNSVSFIGLFTILCCGSPNMTFSADFLSTLFVLAALLSV